MNEGMRLSGKPYSRQGTKPDPRPRAAQPRVHKAAQQEHADLSNALAQIFGNANSLKNEGLIMAA